jgi:mono/diheme cytochrome c family protein
MRRGTLGFLVSVVIAIAFLFTLQTLIASNPERKNWELFTEMSYSVAYEPLSPNPLFASGATQQPLVEGVVARGHLPFPFGPGEEEGRRAGRELKNPFSADNALARAQGAELYRIYCVTCHGATGDGNGPVVARGFPPPASLLAARQREMEDGWIYQVLTRGQGRMASFAAQLAPEERWKVILHVRSLQQESQQQ